MGLTVEKVFYCCEVTSEVGTLFEGLDKAVTGMYFNFITVTLVNPKLLCSIIYRSVDESRLPVLGMRSTLTAGEARCQL